MTSQGVSAKIENLIPGGTATHTDGGVEAGETKHSSQDLYFLTKPKVQSRIRKEEQCKGKAGLNGQPG